MKRLEPIALWLGTLVVVAFALLFFEADQLWKVQYHNVFLHSALYFKQMMVVPGGMLSYLGTYFTQHFYYPWIGVVLLCGWWLLLMWLTERTFNIPERWKVLTLIPVAILLLANMDMGYWVYPIKLKGWYFDATVGVTVIAALLWAFRVLSAYRIWRRVLIVVTVVSTFRTVESWTSWTVSISTTIGAETRTLTSVAFTVE